MSFAFQDLVTFRAVLLAGLVLSRTATQSVWAAEYSENFNVPPVGWTFDAPVGGVGWNADQTPATFPSGPSRSGNSLNYNNGVDYAGTNSGGARSPVISLTELTNPVLKFWSNVHTETRGTTYDQRFVQIWDAAGVTKLAEWQLATVGYSFDPSGGLLGIGPGPSREGFLDLETGVPVTAWHQHKIYLDPAWGSIRIRFYFNSVDDQRNGYSGWAIDDLTVTSNTTPPPTGWPDVRPDTTGSYGLNTCRKASNTLRWSWASGNLGSPGVHLIIGDHPQAIIDSSFMYFDAEHGHYHFSQYADFSLWKMEPGIGFVKLRRSPKRSFCLTDYRALGPGPSVSPGCGGPYQAISSNWQDVYDLNTPGQYIDLTGLAVDAEYYLAGVTDPLNRLRELDNMNNTDQIRFQLKAVDGSVTVLDHSNPYPASSEALTITSASVGLFNGVKAVRVFGTGFDTSLVPVLFGAEQEVEEAPFYTLVSATEIWVNVPPEIPTPATLDLLRARGDAASFRMSIGPYLSVKATQWDDDALDGSTGNGDGILNPGETIGLRVTLQNAGTEIATGVSASLALVSADPYLSITADTVPVGDIPKGGEVTPAGQFFLQIAPGTPTPRVISVRLTLQDNAGHSWTKTLDVPVHVSSLIFGKVITATGGLALEGAEVEYSGPTQGIQLTAANGSFTFLALNGTYTIRARAVGYVESDSVMVVAPPSTGSVDFALGNPDIQAPLSLSGVVEKGTTSNLPFTLNNTGDVPLTFSFWSTDFRVSNSNAPSGPAYAWIDISATGTRIANFTNNTNLGPFALGFTFPFYGKSFDSFRLCSNGWLSFSARATASSNTPLPSRSAPRNLVAFFWDDLDFRSGGAAYYQQIDPQTMVVQFSDVPFLVSGGFRKLTCEVILKSDGSIRMQYQRVDTLDSCTIGVQDSTRSKGVQLTFNEKYVSNGMAVEFLPGFGAPWVHIQPEAGSVAALSGQPLTALFSSTGLAVGTYTAKLGVLSNDPDEPLVEIPISLTVKPPNRPPVITSLPLALPNPVLLPATATVSVVASDDGLPLVPGALSYTWSKSTGPGTVSFSPNATTDANASTATFSAAGRYVLKVKVSDGLKSDTGSVSITVSSP